MPKNARSAAGGNATISDADWSTTSTASTTKSAYRRRRKLRLLCRSQDWMAVVQSHRETRRQHLHLQLRSGRLHNGRRVGAHGSRHHLRNGGDFGFLERIPENRRRVSTGHPLTTHICAAESVHERGTHRTCLAQVTRIAVSSSCA